MRGLQRAFTCHSDRNAGRGQGRRRAYVLGTAGRTHPCGRADRSLGNLPDAKDFLEWAVENFIGAYIWHGVVDRRDAPRWNPDWISPEFLCRARGSRHLSLHGLPDAERPAHWTTAIESAFARLKEMGNLPAAIFPGPLTIFAKVPYHRRQTQFFGRWRRGLKPRQSSVTCRGCSVANSVQLSERAVADIAIASWPAADPLAAGEPELPYLRLCAHVAANSRSEPLAEAVINRCLYKARNRTSGEALTTFLR